MFAIAGFRRSYYGYAMSTHYTQAKSEFLCVDASAEPLPTASDKGSQNGNLLYPVECEPGCAPGYQTDWEITCAVCEGVLG